MSKPSLAGRSFLIEQAGVVVAAYVSHNARPAADLPVRIAPVQAMLRDLRANPRIASAADAPVAAPASAAEIAASIGQDGRVSFIDRKPYKSLKRHLTAHGLGSGSYRKRYGRPVNDPMVAPNDAKLRAAWASRAMHGVEAT